MNLKQAIFKEAYSLGFSAIGVASANYDPVGHNHLLRWLERGLNADMKYMERATRQRFDPKMHLESAKSVIICALNYYNKPDSDPAKPYISLYGRGENYHAVMNDKLNDLSQKITEIPGMCTTKIFADSAAFAEKWFTVKAGLGFIGRNGVVIMSPRNGDNIARGSFYFLGAVISDLELEADMPNARDCGNCHLCMEACPTRAIIDDKVIDATRCIAYHTTQNKGEIPREISSKMGNMVFGCDICQLACPHNNKAISSDEQRFKVNPLIEALDIEKMMAMTEYEFERIFYKSSVREKGYNLFKRNVAIASKNIRINHK